MPAGRPPPPPAAAAAVTWAQRHDPCPAQWTACPTACWPHHAPGRQRRQVMMLHIGANRQPTGSTCLPAAALDRPTGCRLAAVQAQPDACPHRWQRMRLSEAALWRSFTVRVYCACLPPGRGASGAAAVLGAVLGAAHAYGARVRRCCSRLRCILCASAGHETQSGCGQRLCCA